jgi:hypothetical protein
VQLDLRLWNVIMVIKLMIICGSIDHLRLPVTEILNERQQPA